MGRKNVLRRTISGALAILTMLLALSVMQASAAVDPPSVTDTLAPGESIDVAKTVDTPEIPPNPEIFFLADTTGSMGGAIANVQANATTIMGIVQAAQATAKFGVAEYRDVGDSPEFALNQGLTGNIATAQAAISTWSAGGGGDTPEAQLAALKKVADSGGWSVTGTPVIVWFGDASGHDPSGTPGTTLAGAIAALNSAGTGVTVIAIPVPGADGLDSTGQATAIAAATGGSVNPAASANTVATAILTGLSNLPITVTPVAVGCDPLNISFNPTSRTETSGDDALFTETIAVPSNPALAGSEVHCTVEFQDEGGTSIGDQAIWITIPIAIDADPDTDTNELGVDSDHTVTATVTSGTVAVPGTLVSFDVLSGPNTGETDSDTTDASGVASFTYAPVDPGLAGLGTDSIQACVTGADGGVVCDTVSKTWADTTPPEAACDPTTNPHGATSPQAGADDGRTGPGSGVNEDGFFILGATDIVDPDPQIFVVDSGSGTVFGPYSVGTFLKYVEDSTATPSASAMGSNNGGGSGAGNGEGEAVDVQIIGNGDALIFAVDTSGNVSDPVACLVPAPPK